ncbi:MAG: UvrD-helicase domain-containing protein [Alphaproteobacteria bacterium]|uniref:DNA 3'-5' helicase n=1 Tax=Candidatus Nitrobium versatile TaxID=2884831 RepID=A0A953JAB7_9BACT|nr:UvrD-helicase domain-containing protein [Candidatus Nitrobium versatile]
MKEPYLDITKSVMISSPAGSGKTEKLSRRYIALLQGGAEVERILAITFTEKAAAEMKERILSILRREDPALFESVREKMPRMRISTIHSFCLKLMKRFCIELGMDLSLDVMDSFTADMLWEEAVYEALLDDGTSGGALFYELMQSGGVRGWNQTHLLLRALHEKRPAVEFGFRRGGLALEGNDLSRFAKVVALYEKCLGYYRRKKREKHFLDYNDLELMAHEAVSTNPEWQNVLFSFDEHTDHLLVDEFQDTSSLQWMIIDKLTEEWRSGLGAKREAGKRPTIFLVGDDKQSIYSFRGANVDIFRSARNKLSEWLGDEYHFIEVKENYRSLPAVVHFVNTLFERVMPRGLYDARKVEYIPFKATREGEGRVELLLCDSAGNTKENRKREAALIARKIQGVRGAYEVFEGRERRRCRYGDMAILLRNRTHLPLFEDALRREGVPFIVVKGIGFYNTPEIGILRDLLFFLIDPLNDYSLFTLLRSPLFSLRYDTLLATMGSIVVDDISVGLLYSSLAPRRDASGEGGDDPVRKAVAVMESWLQRVKDTPYAVLLEEILCETGAWQYFGEKQRYVNVKKFIKLVEDFEAQGLTGLEIREKLIKASEKADEPKANVNAEGMDAVRIMTIHASKGLQFPVVFLPCLDEGGQTRTGSIIMDEEGERIVLGFEEDAEARRTLPLFRRGREKAEDEEKRLFYVAVTRAMDYLCMSGVTGRKPAGRLALLFDAFHLDSVERDSEGGLPFTLEKISLEEVEVPDPEKSASGESIGHRTGPRPDEMVFVDSLAEEYKPRKIWRNVTEEVDEVLVKHGDDWIVLGRAFHRVFEGLSKGTITPGTLEGKVTEILRNEVLSDSRLEGLKNILLADLERLDRAGYLGEIILPRERSFAELPFILEQGRFMYKGRIDRVIIREGTAHIYDYKTYPVAEQEIPELSERYAFQLDIYRKAVECLFSVRARTYLFLTHEARIVG